MPKTKDFVIGAHRGPLFSRQEEDEGLAKTESASGISLTKTPTRGEKWRRHWRRFWLVYLVGNVIFLAILLPIFFLVVIPAVAQLVVNKSDLWLVNAQVEQPKADSIILTLQANVNLKLAIPVRIEPVTLYLFEREYGHDNPYAAVNIPGSTIKGNYTLGVSDQFTPIQNQTVWEKFVKQVLFQEETSLAMYGKMTAYLGVLKSHVTMDKDVVAPTLNKFAGFSMSDATLLLPARDDGTNLIGNITLPNPTVLHFEVGTLNLDIKSGDILIGNVTIKGVTLVPGDNTYPLTGVLDLKAILSNLGAVLKAEASALKTGNLSLQATTSSVVWNGTVVKYYTDILKQLTLNADIGLADTLKNTLKNFANGKNLTGILSSLSGNSGNTSTAVSRRDERDSKARFELAQLLKEDQDVQEAFHDITPERRDGMIDSLIAMY
ncbi:uncharacterized protein N7473_011651 [Penicillium subrubescens]|uniref:uncharacterized protein n=1 Tax=Penicillium subrubescens TaxID=1316194 RepID=UPI00254569BD|nr:uncharacterized protein N7473_011651 [Penicillium subrubescens]KAJ5880598.1 hypothetical protein N7473_011651 [Penicillium subrubescens]